MMPLTIPIIIS